MRLTQTTAPTVEPVTLTEAKAHMRVDGDEDDARLTALITAARNHCEVYTNRQFITASWKLYCDHFENVQLIPRPPFQSVTSITYVDLDGDTQTVTATIYTTDLIDEPGRILLADGQTWPSHRGSQEDRVIIEYKAGYGLTASTVPQNIRTAMLFWIEGVYDGNKDATLACERLLEPYRVGWTW